MKKKSHGKILREESKEYYLSTVPKSYSIVKDTISLFGNVLCPFWIKDKKVLLHLKIKRNSISTTIS